jgi:thiamine kinase-like enzyme
MIAQLGDTIVGMQPLGDHPETATALHITLSDGREAKLRLVKNLHRVERMQELLPLLDGNHFPPMIARHGRVVIERWIEGSALTVLETDERIHESAGALLAAVHRTALDDAHRRIAVASVNQRLARLELDLVELAQRGLLPLDDARRGLSLAERHAPDTLEIGLVHRDFCAANIVMGDGGTLWVVDNELVAIDSLDLDLARTWYRWPMTDRARAAFRTGYETRRPTVAFRRSFPFWIVGVLAKAVLVRLAAGTADARVPLDRLRAVLMSAG